MYVRKNETQIVNRYKLYTKQLNEQAIAENERILRKQNDR